MAGAATARGAVLKGDSLRKAEHHCFRGFTDVPVLVFLPKPVCIGCSGEKCIWKYILSSNCYHKVKPRDVFFTEDLHFNRKRVFTNVCKLKQFNMDSGLISYYWHDLLDCL